jgi:hypothetical protein
MDRIIKEKIQSIEILHNYSNNHILFKCSINNIINLNIENWSHNRPPDFIRCNDIAKYICMRKPELDWLFYINYNSETDNFAIIDGIHRFCALKIIMDENNKDTYNLSPNFLIEKYLLISLRIDYTFGEISDLFLTINKSIPVPELYINNNSQEKKEAIEKVVNKWTTNYKPHFSSNVKPNIPNINRDKFIDILDLIYEKNKFDNSNNHFLDNKLIELNNLVKNIIINEHIIFKKLFKNKKISDKILEKCNKNDCFIFLLNYNQIDEYLDFIM